MRKILALTLFAPSLLVPQPPAPSILGVWKADLSKSTFSRRPPTEYLEVIEEKTIVLDRRTQEKGQQIEELSGATGQHGSERELLAFVPNSRPYLRSYEGVPAQITAAWDGNQLNLTANVAGRPISIKRVYRLSPDKQTLTVETTITGMGADEHNIVVLLKAPDSAGAPLRQPEETAEAHFKNVKTDALKAIPKSELIDNMRYFAWALDKQCEFCHVRDHFDSDDKKEKKTAREMIKMNTAINHDFFKDRPEVRCFTCHEFHSHPLSHPLFPDELARMQAAAAAAAAEQQHGPRDQSASPGGSPSPSGPPPHN